MKSAYQLFHEATRDIREDTDVSIITPKTVGCACCGRDWASVEDPHQAMVYRYASGYSDEYLCTTCYTPRLPCKDVLGIERLAGKSTPVYGKLGMLTGAGAVITPSGVMHLALNNGWMQKYEQGRWGQKGQLSVSKALPLLVTLLIEGKMEPLSEGFIYIENFGVKPDVLMSGLLPSFSLDEVWCNSDKGVSMLDINSFIATAKELAHQDMQKKAATYSFWSPITQAAKGVRKDAAIEKWVKQLPDAKAVMAKLPVDPHSRLRLPSIMQEIMPYVAEGVLK